MKKQLVKNQKGEIEFRKKLYMQQVEDNKFLEGELDSSDLEKILKDRMKKTYDQMISLQKKEIPLSPYIEIGAERCQRSLVMENELGLNGAAIDISYDMLKSCSHYQKNLKKSKTPLRICCDANNLPLKSNSIPFAFCYETLHHFPEPTPITKEIYRVLKPEGYFFFAEEPFKQVLHINLYKTKKMHSKKELSKGMIKRILDRFFCERSCNETDHSIIENDDISIALWKESLNHFDKKNVELRVMNSLKSDLFNPESYIKRIAAYLLGGSISGICKKSGDTVDQILSIYDALICPSCKDSGKEKSLVKKDSTFICPECSKIYPVKDGVLFLFAYDKFRELYSEILSSVQV
jgi:ubiquinone/menaquinone biosynthesis C-methylase UbiE/uncharacterized protein YbaR (Trm112 family)